MEDQSALLSQSENMNVGSLDGLVILDNVQSYNLFQRVSQDKEHGSDYQEQDLLPEDYGDDPSYEETEDIIVDKDPDDKMKISIGFKVDKTSDIITLLEKDRTQSINPDITDRKIPPEQDNFQPQKNQTGVKNKLSSPPDKSKVGQEKSLLEFANDLESLVFGEENSLEKLSNVTRIEMFSDIMSHKNEEEKEFDKNEVNKNSKDVSQPPIMSLHSINQEDKESEERNEDNGALIKREDEDVVYILYLSKDGLDDLSNIDNE